MAAFKDAQGRDFRVPVTLGAVRRCKEMTGTDLMTVVDKSGELLNQLANDPILLCNVLYAICKPQCDELGLSDEDFGEGLVGDPIDQAAAALMEGLADFFPGPKRRAIKNAVKKLNALLAKREQRLIENLEDPRLAEKLDAALEAEARELLDRALSDLDDRSGSSSTSSPASAASPTSTL